MCVRCPLLCPHPWNSTQHMVWAPHMPGVGGQGQIGKAGIYPGDPAKWRRTLTRKEMGPDRYGRGLTRAVGQRQEIQREFCSHQAGEGGV